MEGVKFAVITVAMRHLNFTMLTQHERTSVYLIEGIQGPGKKFVKSLINVFYYVLTAIEKLIPACSFPPKGGLKNRVNSGKPQASIDEG